MTKILRLYYSVLITILSILLLPASLFSQEMEPDTNNDRQKEAVSAPTQQFMPKIETPAHALDKMEVSPGIIEKTIPSYRVHLKEILKEAEENIKKVDKEIVAGEIRARNEEREARIMEAFEKGNALYQEGDLKKAKE